MTDPYHFPKILEVARYAGSATGSSARADAAASPHQLRAVLTTWDSVAQMSRGWPDFRPGLMAAHLGPG